MSKLAKPHIIENISFSLDSLECSCGWIGTIDDYQPHRKEAGLEIKEFDGRRNRTRAQEPSIWSQPAWSNRRRG